MLLLLCLSTGCLDVVEHGVPTVLNLTTTDCSGASVLQGATQLRFTAKSGDSVLLTRVIPIASITTTTHTIALPEATDVQLRVEALDDRSHVFARGSAVHFDVVATKPPTVSLEFFRAGRFSRVCGTLGTPRAFHSATLLPDGRVLIVGGVGASGQTLSSREVIGGSEVRDVGPLAIRAQGNSYELPRARHAAIQVPSGMVLVSGGQSGAGLSNIALFIDPLVGFDIGAIGPQPLQNVTRSGHAAFKVGTDVFLVGGVTTQTGPSMPNPWVERIDLTTNRILPVTELPEPRLDSALAQLDAVAVIAGGLDGTAPSAKVDLLTMLAPGIPARLTLGTARTAAAAVTVGDRVLIAGGVGPTGPVASTEWIQFSPPSVEAGPSITARSEMCAVLLPGGRALLLGGLESNRASGAAEIVDANGSTPVPFPAPARHGHSCVSLEDGSVLIAGGLDAAGHALDDLWRFTPAD